MPDSKSRITKIGIGVSQTINTGNYESIRPSVYYEAEVHPDDDHNAIRRRLQRVAYSAFLKMVSFEINIIRGRKTVTELEEWVEEAAKLSAKEFSGDKA